MIRLNSKYTNFFCNTFLINYYSSFFYKYLMYNLIVNTNHELVTEILNTKTAKKKERLVNQALDLAKLSKGLLKGEDMTAFINRSYEMIK